MNAPKRWIDMDSGSSDFERAILEPATEIEIPAGAEEQVWSGLTAFVSVAAVPAAVAATVAGSEVVGGASGSAAGGMGASAAKLALSGLVKAFGVGALGGTLLAGGYTALDSYVGGSEHEQNEAVQAGPAEKLAGSKTEARALAPPSLPEAEIAPVAPASGARPHEPSPPTESSLTPAPSSPAVAAFDAVLSPAENAANRQGAASRLREEARVLARARAALRRGDLASAFAALEVARSEFAGGMLSEEREALTIELLARSGQREAARARAQRFLRAFPRSAHADGVRRFAD